MIPLVIIIFCDFLKLEIYLTFHSVINCFEDKFMIHLFSLSRSAHLNYSVCSASSKLISRINISNLTATLSNILLDSTIFLPPLELIGITSIPR